MRVLLFIILSISNLFCINGQEVVSFKSSDGEDLYYTSIGKGPSVVFLFGGPGYAVSAMKPWADTLDGEFKCILFDQRGTGLSSDVKLDTSTINLKRATKDLDELRQHLGEDKLVLCGISWGGMLAQAYAAYYHENTEKIVLVSTLGPDLSLLSAFSDNMNMRRFPAERDSLSYWLNQPSSDHVIMKRYFFNYLPEFYDHSIGHKMLPEFFSSTTYNEQMANLMWMDLSSNYDLKESLKAYKGQCIIIRPRQDPVPAESIYMIKEILPQSKIINIEKCGHFPDYEKPAEFFSILRKILQTCKKN